MNIHLRSFGKGKALVFFHGWGFDGSIWESVVPLLAENYQVFIVDLPGFGSSDLMDWSAFKTKLITYLPETFALIGWSMGGLFATRLALEEPNRVTHLLNCCSSPCFVARESWPGVPLIVFQNFYSNLAMDLQNTLNDFVSLQTNKMKVELKQLKLPTLHALQGGLAILEKWDLRPELSSLRAQTHYLFGRLDPITPVKTMEAMQLTYPEFEYTLFNKSAHMPFLSQSHEFINLIKETIR